MEKHEQVKRAEQLLREVGFRLKVWGCGCCGSPNVRLEYKGEDIIFDESVSDRVQDMCYIDMFEEQK